MHVDGCDWVWMHGDACEWLWIGVNGCGCMWMNVDGYESLCMVWMRADACGLK